MRLANLPKKNLPQHPYVPKRTHFNQICCFRQLNANRVRSALLYTQPRIAWVKRSLIGCQTQQKPSGCLVGFKSPKHCKFGTWSTLYCNLQKKSYSQQATATAAKPAGTCQQQHLVHPVPPSDPQSFSSQIPHICRHRALICPLNETLYSESISSQLSAQNSK